MIIHSALFGPAIILLARLASALSVNRTIDDQFGDSVTGAVPSKAPTDVVWNVGQTCTQCAYSPGLIDPGKAFHGTWTDTTQFPGEPEHVVTVYFSGTAVYVYNLLVNVVPVKATANLSFSIDGVLRGQFLHVADNSSAQDVIYNACVFSAADLEDQAHSLEMRTNGPGRSLMLFDYVVYTVNEPDDTPTTSEAPPISTPQTTRVPSLPTTSSSSDGSSLQADAPRATGSGISASVNPAASHSAPFTSSSADLQLTSSLPPEVEITETSISPSSSSINSLSNNSSFPSPSRTHSGLSPAGAIVGGVVGGVTVIAVAAIVALLCCKRRKQAHLRPDTGQSGVHGAVDRNMTVVEGRCQAAAQSAGLAAASCQSQQTPPASLAYYERKQAPQQSYATNTGSLRSETHSDDDAAPPNTDSSGTPPAYDGRDLDSESGSITTGQGLLRHIEALWQELGQLWRRELEQLPEDVPPRYDQLSTAP